MFKVAIVDSIFILVLKCAKNTGSTTIYV